ncbi:MAG: radical SAM protein [Candidatus Omnitrophica bacterium]|nr:radical SAM protein [Candidatus Omnitrophota bacterium]MDD5352465.1 radical SAM protein [Candidatus Omnitrophota bacterium]MDD5550063.1 radical SAM protein [Candidatus Omnitrophota bacterium]
MKILLINPSQEKVYGIKLMPAYPPLGLLYVGTVLKNSGHEVRLLDIDTEGINEDKFKDVFKEFDPAAVGITSVTPTINDALKWARISKGIKNIPVVLGGIHATITAEEIIVNDSVDIVVVGEGEATADELFRELEQPSPNLRNIKGIWFKEKGRPTICAARPLIDNLDMLPFPDIALIKNANAFMPPDATDLPVATIITSRGCPGECSFCCVKQIFSRRFRARSVKNIIAEIKELINRNGIKEIHIADDTFTLIKQRVLDFCREIKNQNIKVNFQFMNGLRADFVDRDILTALKETGFKTVGYGVESANPEILKNIKKHIPLETTKKAFKLSKELGFETWAFLIFGLPGESEYTIRETIDFSKEIDPDFAKFYILKPYPGSEVYKQLKKDNLLLSDNYDDYGIYTKPVHRLAGLEPQRIIYWQKRAYREFYLRPGKIISQIRRVKSIKQLRLVFNAIKLVLHNMFKNQEQ